MACDEIALGVGKDWVGEPERADRSCDLFNLAFRMSAGIARVGGESAYGKIADFETLVGIRSCQLVILFSCQE